MYFETTKEEDDMICKIIDTFCEVATEQISSHQRFNLVMDLQNAHTRGCPLDLEKMLNGSRGCLTHDVSGIHNNIDRTTGELQNCFVPRCAKNQ